MYIGVFKRKRPKQTLSPKLIMPLYVKNDKLWGCDKTEWFGLGAVNYETVTRKYMGNTSGSWVIFVGFLVQFHFGDDFQYLMIRSSFVPGMQRASLPWEHGNFYDLPLDRKKEARDLFLHLLFLKWLQLKTINMSEQHILRWHVLKPFKSIVCI